MDLKNAFFSIELWGAVFCVMIGLSLFRTEKRGRGYKFLALMTAALSVMLFFDAMAWFFRGAEGEVAGIMVRAGNALSFLMLFILPALFYPYFFSTVEKEEGREMLQWLAPAVYGISIFSVILLTISQFNGMLYYIDDGNVYHRGSWFLFVSALYLLVLLLLLFAAVYERKNISKDRFPALVFFTAFPLAAVVVQMFHYGWPVLNLVLVLGAANIFAAEIRRKTNILETQEDRIGVQNEEIVNLQTRIALSQIKPHFLYNALNSIYILCGSDLETGRNAISDLSDYLRMNIGSIESVAPIPFEKEMEHVNTYMSIEKLRFGEDLDFSVITPVTDFLLPALTLQPLVENAVRHGIVPTGREGIILITTRETEQHYVISISDNGMGFDIKSLDTDEGKHIGIRNVRERLKMQMNASLEISSIPGSGTEVTVRIPKQNRYAENSDRQVKI